VRRRRRQRWEGEGERRACIGWNLALDFSDVSYEEGDTCVI